MQNKDSARLQYLRTTVLLGGATAAGLLIALVRMKVIAVLIGPAGVGLLGILTTLMMMGYSILGMAIETTGIRQLSSSLNDSSRLRIVHWALWTFGGALAVLSVFAFWLLRHPLTELVMGSRDQADIVGLLGAGIAISIIAACQMAIVQSHREFKLLTRIRIGSAFLAAAVSVTAIWLYGVAALWVAVLITPLATLLFAFGGRGRLPAIELGAFPGREVFSEWKIFVALGATVTVAASIGSAGQAAVRALILQRFGVDSAGLYQASFTISSLNMSLVLAAMASDYYPRLSSAASRPAEMTEIFNHQLSVAITLAAPALLGISLAAPLVLQILFSDQFTGATPLLRFHLAADALRLAGWGLGYVLLARGASTAYVIAEGMLTSVFLLLTWTIAPRWGLSAVGAFYVIGYAASLAVALRLAADQGVFVSRRLLVQAVGLSLVLVAFAGLSFVEGPIGWLIGGSVFLVVTAASIREMLRLGFLFPLPAFLRWSSKDDNS